MATMTHNVTVPLYKKKDGKTRWLKLGKMMPKDDGSFSIALDWEAIAGLYSRYLSSDDEDKDDIWAQVFPIAPTDEVTYENKPRGKKRVSVDDQPF